MRGMQCKRREEAFDLEIQFQFQFKLFSPLCTSKAHFGDRRAPDGEPGERMAFQSCEQAGLESIAEFESGLWMLKWPATKSRPCLLAAESVFAHPLNETVDVSSRRRLPSKNNTAAPLQDRVPEISVTFISICLASATSRFHSHARPRDRFFFYFLFSDFWNSELKTLTRGSGSDAGDSQRVREISIGRRCFTWKRAHVILAVKMSAKDWQVWCVVYFEFRGLKFPRNTQKLSRHWYKFGQTRSEGFSSKKIEHRERNESYENCTKVRKIWCFT